MTTTVTFGKVWLNPVADPSTGAPFACQAIDLAPTVTVTTRMYADGRPRAIATPGRQRTAKLTMGFLTDAQVTLLEQWEGQEVWYRDPRGSKWAGIYVDLDAQPRPLPNSWATTLTLTEVYETEAV